MSASPRRSQREADVQARFRVLSVSGRFEARIGPTRSALREARLGRPTTHVFRAAFDAVSLTDHRLAFTLAIALPLTLTLACLSYYLVERPLLRLKYRQGSAQAARSAAS